LSDSLRAQEAIPRFRLRAVRFPLAADPRVNVFGWVATALMGVGAIALFVLAALGK
jgi:hypothetical protein